jgi:hypothetical protein
LIHDNPPSTQACRNTNGDATGITEQPPVDNLVNIRALPSDQFVIDDTLAANAVGRRNAAVTTIVRAACRPIRRP